MKEKKITETITLYRLNFSLIVIAIFGNWMALFYEGFYLGLYFVFVLGFLLLFLLSPLMYIVKSKIFCLNSNECKKG